jgi:hypothetical protein
MDDDFVFDIYDPMEAFSKAFINAVEKRARTYSWRLRMPCHSKHHSELKTWAMNYPHRAIGISLLWYWRVVKALLVILLIMLGLDYGFEAGLMVWGSLTFVIIFVPLALFLFPAIFCPFQIVYYIVGMGIAEDKIQKLDKQLSEEALNKNKR